MVFETMFGQTPYFVTCASELPALITGLRTEERLHEDALRVFCKDAVFLLDASNNWELREFSERELSHVRKLGVKLQFAELANFTAERFVAIISMTPNVKEVGIDCHLPDYYGVDWIYSFLQTFPGWFAGFKAARKIVLRFPWLPKNERENIETTIADGLQCITKVTGISGRLESTEETRKVEIKPHQRYILADQEVCLRSVLENQQELKRLTLTMEWSHFRETWVWEAEEGKEMDFSGLLNVRSNATDIMLLGGALEGMSLGDH